MFPTGFAANAGVIPALADGGDCEIFSDRLNHASIVDALYVGAYGHPHGRWSDGDAAYASSQESAGGASSTGRRA